MVRVVGMTLLLALGTVFLDQISKYWAASKQLTVLNSGVSFGLLPDLAPSLMLAALALIWLIIAYLLLKSPDLNLLGKGLVIGGGASNIIDRVLLAGVRDWLPVPGFNLQNNLADYALVVGCVLLLVSGRSRKVELN